jgi:hypothetical protein
MKCGDLGGGGTNFSRKKSLFIQITKALKQPKQNHTRFHMLDKQFIE